MQIKNFKIELIGFKSNGKYYSEYEVTGNIQYHLNGTEEYPYLPDAIDLVELAKAKKDIPSDLDYLINTGVPHFIKVN